MVKGSDFTGSDRAQHAAGLGVPRAISEVTRTVLSPFWNQGSEPAEM